MTADENSEKKLRDEYDILTKHYFHEGTLMLTRNQFFIAVNFGLFTIMGFLSKESHDTQFRIPGLLPLLCILGLTISLFWANMTARARSYIKLRVGRMKEIEDQLGYEILLRLEKEQHQCQKSLSTSTLFISLGFAFAMLWSTLLLLKVLNG